MKSLLLRSRSERGAEIIEYAIALAILLVVFVVASFSLQRASRERGEASMKSSGNMVPYIGPTDTLCNLGSDACK